MSTGPPASFSISTVGAVLEGDGGEVAIHWVTKPHPNIETVISQQVMGPCETKFEA
jgi:hypothetical protein